MLRSHPGPHSSPHTPTSPPPPAPSKQPREGEGAISICWRPNHCPQQAGLPASLVLAMALYMHGFGGPRGNTSTWCKGTHLRLCSLHTHTHTHTHTRASMPVPSWPAFGNPRLPKQAEHLVQASLSREGHGLGKGTQQHGSPFQCIPLQTSNIVTLCLLGV